MSLEVDLPDLVAVLLGATSGIGAATARELVLASTQPHLYIVGQNEARGGSLVKELRALNKRAKLTFIRSDLTLLRNVDRVCSAIAKEQTRVNLLFMTAGILSMGGRDETPEGLDKMYSLQYFARIRCTVNLLPQLRQAAGAQQLARVVSVLGAGNEGKILDEDLDLKHHFSLRICSGQAMSMTSIALEHLARHDTNIDFVHAYPGPVRGTNILCHMGKLIGTCANVAMTIFAPFTLSLPECAKIQCRIALAPDLKSLQAARAKLDSTMVLLRLNAKGQPCGPNIFVSSYIQDAMMEKIWAFTQGVFQRVCS